MKSSRDFRAGNPAARALISAPEASLAAALLKEIQRLVSPDAAGATDTTEELATGPAVAPGK